MRVLIISHDFYPNIGGIAAHVFNLSKGLSRKGNDVYVFSIRYSSTLPFFETLGNMKIYRFLVPNIHFLRGIFFIVQGGIMLFLKSIFQRFDVIHWHNMFPDTLIALFGRSQKRIFTNHSSTFLDFFAEKRKPFFLRFPFFLATSIIAPSLELAEKSKEFFGSIPVFCISNAVDTEFFFPVNQEVREKEKKEIGKIFNFQVNTPVIICPRRIEPKNGIDFLVESIPSVLSKYPSVIFLFAGNDAAPDYAETIRARVAELDIQKQTRFLGAIKNTEMPTYFHIADIAVLPSLMEATSIAGLEAMACGVPLVGTRVGGIPEIIEDGKTGILVPSQDADMLAKAIITLLQSEELRRNYGRNARERVEKLFSWEFVVQKTLAVYNV